MISRNYLIWRTEKNDEENKKSFRDLWETIKHINMCDGREWGQKRKRRKRIFKVTVAQNLPNIMNNINLHAWEAQEIPNIINMKNLYIVTSQKKAKEKERFLKAAREKKTDSIQGTPLWLAVDFPSKTFKVRVREVIYSKC